MDIFSLIDGWTDTPFGFGLEMDMGLEMRWRMGVYEIGMMRGQRGNGVELARQNTILGTYLGSLEPLSLRSSCVLMYIGL